MRWSVCISKSQESLYVLFSRTDTGFCMTHVFLWSNLDFLHNTQWMTLPTQSCLDLYAFCANLLHYYNHYYYSLKFFSSALADGFSLDFEWQQVSSSFKIVWYASRGISLCLLSSQINQKTEKSLYKMYTLFILCQYTDKIHSLILQYVHIYYFHYHYFRNLPNQSWDFFALLRFFYLIRQIFRKICYSAKIGLYKRLLKSLDIEFPVRGKIRKKYFSWLEIQSIILKVPIR